MRQTVAPQHGAWIIEARQTYIGATHSGNTVFERVQCCHLSGILNSRVFGISHKALVARTFRASGF